MCSEIFIFYLQLEHDVILLKMAYGGKGYIWSEVSHNMVFKNITVKIAIVFSVIADDEIEGATASKSSKAEKKGQKKELKRSPSFTATDDIDKMKVSFVYENDMVYTSKYSKTFLTHFIGDTDMTVLL